MKNKVNNDELIVVPKANPMFRESPIRPETILTSPFGATFITEVPFETVKVVKAPAENATNGIRIKMISRKLIGNILKRIARDNTKKLNSTAPNEVDFLASNFSAKKPANGPITAIARGGTTIRIHVCSGPKNKNS